MASEKKRQQALIDIINKMFEIAGHDVTYADVEGRQDDWYMQWTMTNAQYKEWQDWGIKYLSKNLRINKKWAAREMGMIGLMYGLKFSDRWDMSS